MADASVKRARHGAQAASTDMPGRCAIYAAADVTFEVDGQQFPTHRCVLVARSAYFRDLFEAGACMQEGTSEPGKEEPRNHVLLAEVSAAAFRVLLKYLYKNELPEEEDCGEGLESGEMARVADRFQALDLFARCIEVVNPLGLFKILK